jgi:23S rRNA (cytosine1962-C5)-methyltransferase
LGAGDTWLHSAKGKSIERFECAFLCVKICIGSVSLAAMKIYSPTHWKEYQLIDSGHGQKLEQFGSLSLIRPEPQAIWQPKLSENEWKKLANARFDREQKDKYRFSDEVNGGWKKDSKTPENWQIQYGYKELQLKLRLALTSFGHVGVFPEQANNWNFIWETVKAMPVKTPRVLNLFAYTGAASMVACAAGAQVTHVDASRPGINWANQNMQLNGLKDIRWVYEDAFKFVKREAKRGNTYHGIIMDPPPYGRGPSGEKWTLQEQLGELVASASSILEPNNAFFILSMYAVGLSALVGKNIVADHLKWKDLEFGEFLLQGKAGHDLPMGTFVRLSR